MKRRAFEKLVAEALAEIPEELARRLENVDVVIEDEPDPELLEEMGMDPETSTLFGLYQGVPLTQRDSRYGLVLPDKITIFRFPIEDECESAEQIKAEIRRTVVHEIAHHFGISDARLRELGY
ncbi:MAG: metallopeptidase family protein [Acidobacteriota bacterium]